MAKESRESMISLNDVAALAKAFSAAQLGQLAGGSQLSDCVGRCGCVGGNCECNGGVWLKQETSVYDFSVDRRDRIQALRQQLTSLEADERAQRNG